MRTIYDITTSLFVTADSMSEAVEKVRKILDLAGLTESGGFEEKTYTIVDWASLLIPENKG